MKEIKDEFVDTKEKKGITVLSKTTYDAFEGTELMQVSNLLLLRGLKDSIL